MHFFKSPYIFQKLRNLDKLLTFLHIFYWNWNFHISQILWIFQFFLEISEKIQGGCQALNIRTLCKNGFLV
jgi:hypothetical protein